MTIYTNREDNAVLDNIYIYTDWWFGTMEFYDFPCIGNFMEFHHPNWLIFVSEVLKPPTSIASIDIVYTDIVSLD